MTHPNEHLGREANAAFGRGDLSALQNYFAEDIRWHIPGAGPLSGHHEGIAQVMALVSKISELSRGTARLDLHDTLANDTHTVTLATIRAERAGKRYQDNLVQVAHVQDGKVTEIWTHPADPDAAAEFWS